MIFAFNQFKSLLLSSSMKSTSGVTTREVLHTQVVQVFFKHSIDTYKTIPAFWDSVGDNLGTNIFWKWRARILVSVSGLLRKIGVFPVPDAWFAFRGIRVHGLILDQKQVDNTRANFWLSVCTSKLQRHIIFHAYSSLDHFRRKTVSVHSCCLHLTSISSTILASWFLLTILVPHLVVCWLQN